MNDARSGPPRPPRSIDPLAPVPDAAHAPTPRTGGATHPIRQDPPERSAPVTAPPAPPAPTPAPVAHGAPHAAPSHRTNSIILFVLSVLLYVQTVGYELVYDDWFLIQNNASMEAAKEGFGGALKLFAQEYWEGINPDKPAVLTVQGQALYRPLSLFLWSLIYSVTEVGHTAGYHLLSILVNAGVVVLLYRVLERLFRSTRVGFTAALLFALHPLHSEAVAYVAGLHDVLATGAVLLGLLLFLRARRADGGLRAGSCAGVLATLFVGLLAKESAVLLIPVVALSDWLLARRDGAPRLGSRLGLYGAMLAVFAAHLAIRMQVVGYLTPLPGAISLLDNPIPEAPSLVSVANGLALIARQLWLFLWPATLSMDYSFDAIPLSDSLLDPAPLSAAVLVAALLAFGLLNLRRWPAMAWGVLVFLGCSLLTSNIFFRVGTIFAERLAYLPSVGAAVAAAALFDRLLLSRGRPDRPLHPAVLLVLVVVCGALGLRTIERNKDFEDKLTLFESAARAVPRSARVQYQLGTLASEDELFTEAEEYFTRALTIDPTFSLALIARGDMFVQDRNYDQAIVDYETMAGQLAGRAPTPVVIELRGMVQMRLANTRARKGDLAGAEAELRTYIDGRPDDPQGYVALAELLLDQDDAAAALPLLERAVQIRPDHFRANEMMGRAAVMIGDRERYIQALTGLEQTELGRGRALSLKAEMQYVEGRAQGNRELVLQALDIFDEVRELLPELATPYAYRGRYLFEDGRFYDALIELDRALGKNPRHPMALKYKALAQLRIDNPSGALTTLAVLETINPDADCYTLMAEAHFQLGDFEAQEEIYAKLQELGEEPLQFITRQALAYEQQGRLDDAIRILQESLARPEHAESWELVRHLGITLYLAGRYEEALAAFDQEAEILARDPEGIVDLYLPVNRARALIALDRDVEAAAQLELFEDSIGDDPRKRADLLNRRAQLFLEQDSPFYDPLAALEACDEGLGISGNRFLELFDRSIEAYVALGDLPGALERARAARAATAALPDAPPEYAARYAAAEEALQVALEGNRDDALVGLRASDDTVLARIADKLAL